MEPSSVIPAVLGVMHVAIVVVVLPKIIDSTRPAASIIAWCGALLFAPAIGVVAYFVMGDYRTFPARKGRFAPAASELRAWQTASFEPRVESSIERYIEAVAGFAPVDTAHITLLKSADAVFDALLDDIANAQSSCDLAFYIWESGGRADEVEAALIAAVGRGVRCRVLADGLGSRTFLGGKTASALRQAGVKVETASRLHLVGARWDLRYHRKLAVFDGAYAYVGSQNLVDPRFFKQDAGVGQWVDAMVRVDGAAAACLAALFERDWMVETGEPFEMEPVKLPAHGGRSLQILPTSPELNHDAAHQLMLMAIYQAEEVISITTPYFAPDEALLGALVNAAQRGVDVTIIVPADNDSWLVARSSRAYFRILIPAGVRVARFRDGLLHTKSLIVDDELVIFGSVNFDMRSLWIDSELSVVIHDHEFAAETTELHRSYIENCDVVDTVPASTRLGRLIDNLARLFSPLL